MLAFLISTALWAAPYQQTFHPTAAIPLQLRHHSTAGFTSESWEASLVVVSTLENVTYGVTCQRNSDFTIYAARFLQASTNYTRSFRESGAQNFQQEFETEEACQARIAEVVDDPPGFSLTIFEGKSLKIEKTPKAGG